MNWKQALASLLYGGSGRAVGDDKAAGQPLDEVFTRVYRERLWGFPKPWKRSKFFSGPGSHEVEIINPYIEAVQAFVQPRATMNAVDLGCGDFNVGGRIRKSFNRYTACDIVSELIQHNKRSYADMDVEFCCINISTDPLPSGDIVFLRQVLQHLSNEQIGHVVAKLQNYRFLVLTEHLPDKRVFTPNLDHVSGSGLRLARDSGVVLTCAPFNLQVKSHATLCSVRHFGGVIQTDVYELQ